MHSREQQESLQAHLERSSRLTTAGQPSPGCAAPGRHGWLQDSRSRPPKDHAGQEGFTAGRSIPNVPRWDTCASVAAPAPGRDPRRLLPRLRPAEGPARRAEPERARYRPDPSGPAHGGLYLRREGGGSAPGARSSAPPARRRPAAALPFLPPFLRPSAMPAAPARSLRQRPPPPRAAQFGAAILEKAPLSLVFQLTPERWTRYRPTGRKTHRLALGVIHFISIFAFQINFK
ncbi:splicing factor, proline- and glutamine-rich-like [Passer montanus]|uniref:splicing factor, proline- and glutamine-rich-like n=1 Tax=Passer montanus TaxID=9160 RepID=UPI00196205AF|nr:splicing factor, proline- and glutamine-rich-like [Passer montanus]